jgi:branched-chain amino acid transport system ATP-binding protein
MGLVLGICDRAVVLEFGKVIAEGTPEEVRRNPKVVAAYLGDGMEPAATGPGEGTETA